MKLVALESLTMNSIVVTVYAISFVMLCPTLCTSKRGDPIQVNGGIIEINTTSVQVPANIACSRVVIKRHLGRHNRNCSSEILIRVAFCVGMCASQHELNMGMPMQKHDTCRMGKKRLKSVKIYCSDDNTETLFKYYTARTCVCNSPKTKSRQTRTAREYLTFK